MPSWEAVPRLAVSRGSDVTKLMLDALRGFALRVLINTGQMRGAVTSKWRFWPRARMRCKTVEEPYPGLLVTPTEFRCPSRTSTA